MSPIHQTYHINAPIAEVWQAFVNPEQVEGWSGAPAVMDNKVGTQFKLWGGDIFGENLVVVSQKRLVQSWTTPKWDQASKVTFNLSEKDDITTVELIHENVPEKSYRSINDGWKHYYLGPMKAYLERH